ncbi:hypothetical protein BRC82_05520 [Halobacteriales archaeon QS_1_67_19]|nr:MAG: hypothetical protein BRC82_05520 [Halobacteriales archaeon QS_1_67_19]
MRDSITGKIDEAESAREEAESAREEAAREREQAREAKEQAEELNDRLERRADSYSEVMRACANGDLSQRMNADVDNEAMARIAASYNEMMDDLTETIREVRAFSREVASASEQATDGVAEVERASQEVAESIQEISEGPPGRTATSSGPTRR